MDFIGVDACKKGWFALALDSQDNWKIAVFKTFDDLWRRWNLLCNIFIDIPIGLPSSVRRPCDLETRRILGKRGASVFAVPCREALQARTYREACRINERIMGVMLSIQTWNICAKIREIDTWLRSNPKAQPRIRESHPELCFWALADAHAMVYPKKSSQGFEERYRVLEKNCRHTGAIVQQALDQYWRKDLARDDILDALVLAVSARFSSGMPQTVPLKPAVDKEGLPMQIVYFPGRLI